MQSNYNVAIDVLGLPNFMKGFKEVAQNPIEVIQRDSGISELAGDIDALLEFGNLSQEQLQVLHSDLSSAKPGDSYASPQEGGDTIELKSLKEQLPKIRSLTNKILGDDNGQAWAKRQGRKLTNSLKETFLPIIIKANNYAKTLAS